MVKELNLKPIARLISHAAVGVEPRIMGIDQWKLSSGVEKGRLKLDDIEQIELNEAFASQALVIRTSQLNKEIINVNGGAIALGHPLGCRAQTNHSAIE